MATNEKLGEISDCIVTNEEAARILREMPEGMPTIVLTQQDGGTIVMLATEMSQDKIGDLLCEAVRNIDDRRRAQGITTAPPANAINTFALEFARWQQEMHNLVDINPALSRVSFYTGGLALLKVLCTLTPYLEAQPAIRTVLDEMARYGHEQVATDVHRAQDIDKATAPAAPKGGGT